MQRRDWTGEVVASESCFQFQNTHALRAQRVFWLKLWRLVRMESFFGHLTFLPSLQMVRWDSSRHWWAEYPYTCLLGNGPPCAAPSGAQRCTDDAFASKIRAQNPKNWYNECWSSRAWSSCCLHARSLAWEFWFRAPDLTSCFWSRCCSCCSSFASPSFALSLLFIPSLSSSIRSLSHTAPH